MDWSELAQSCGCIDIACLSPEDVSTEALRKRLTEWQGEGNAGALSYVDERSDILTQPFMARPWAKAALVISFEPVPDPECMLRKLPEAEPGKVAAVIAPYAMNEDYHQTGKRRLQAVVEKLESIYGHAEFECCIDTRPVMEKQFARIGGLGEQGINSLIRNETHGAQIHLGVVFTSLLLPTRLIRHHVNPPCCECHRCIRVCPNSVYSDGRFEIRHCRAWLASEYRQALDTVQQRLLGDTLFGCGRCSLACPATVSPKSKAYRVDPLALLRMPSAQLRSLIKGTILEYTGVTVLKRNAAAVLANATPETEWKSLREELLNCTNSPVVRETLMHGRGQTNGMGGKDETMSK
ncbi:MAG: DUF1730 domain-containing protein [Victivallales bacterium]|nr:DUF1730 domain-containing protein [Victivallales bacterium]